MPSPARSVFCAIVAIAAIYLYFLIYAELALIELVRGLVSQSELTLVLGALATGGISGSLTSAFTQRPPRARLWLMLGQLLCIVGAGLSLLATGLFSAAFASLLVGFGLGWSTVALSLCLRPTLHVDKLGWWCGLGTGLAYFTANQPLVFQATPRVQAVIALIAAVIGLIAALGLRGEPIKRSTSPDYTKAGWALWVLIFLALVWLDSAAFYIIQHTQDIKAATWDSVFALQGNALLHLLTALIAGYLLDHRQDALVNTLALLGLLAACLVIILLHSRYLPLTRVLYVASVSFYSTALVFFPARSVRPLFIAGLFAVAGWIGSALGIGMAQNLQRIPIWFLITATALFTLGMTLRVKLPARR